MIMRPAETNVISAAHAPGDFAGGSAKRSADRHPSDSQPISGDRLVEPADRLEISQVLSGRVAENMPALPRWGKKRLRMTDESAELVHMRKQTQLLLDRKIEECYVLESELASAKSRIEAGKKQSRSLLSQKRDTEQRLVDQSAAFKKKLDQVRSKLAAYPNTRGISPQQLYRDEFKAAAIASNGKIHLLEVEREKLQAAAKASKTKIDRLKNEIDALKVENDKLKAELLNVENLLHAKAARRISRAGSCEPTLGDFMTADDGFLLPGGADLEGLLPTAEDCRWALDFVRNAEKGTAG